MRSLFQALLLALLASLASSLVVSSARGLPRPSRQRRAPPRMGEKERAWTRGLLGLPPLAPATAPEVQASGPADGVATQGLEADGAGVEAADSTSPTDVKHEQEQEQQEQEEQQDATIGTPDQGGLAELASKVGDLFGEAPAVTEAEAAAAEAPGEAPALAEQAEQAEATPAPTPSFAREVAAEVEASAAMEVRNHLRNLFTQRPRPPHARPTPSCATTSREPQSLHNRIPTPLPTFPCILPPPFRRIFAAKSKRCAPLRRAESRPRRGSPAVRHPVSPNAYPPLTPTTPTSVRIPARRRALVDLAAQSAQLI
jgi:hypothetical protein